MKKFTGISVFLLIFMSGYSQNQLEGIVKDSLGVPVAGATIMIKEASIFSVADANGRFIIPAKKLLPYTVRVTSAGYRPKEVRISELQSGPLEISLSSGNQLSEVVITSRRRAESAQAVPIPISIIGGAQVEASGNFNVNRLKELVPTVQL